MKILGDPLFAKNPDGTLKSRIGTLFFRTPGLVTRRGVHAFQRLAWLEEVNRERAAAGKPALTENEAADELADSADLIFTDNLVLIRPDPNRMDLAFKADEALQQLVSKRQIRFLNTHAAKVRDALRARGENWRMARPPLSPEEMDHLLVTARVAIDGAKMYWYNGNTGTRHLTAGAFDEVRALPADAFRMQMAEIVKGLRSFNRLGQGEIALFPSTLPPDVKAAFLALDVENADDSALAAACAALAVRFRAALPPSLRNETAANFDFRNEMCATLLRGPNDTNAAEQELIQGISPEFYRQIEWLPGARVVEGRLVFDSLFDEAARTQDPELLEFCDARVRAILFNLMRLYGSIEYVNVGRISRSLARRPVAGMRRGNVYIVQCKDASESEANVFILRFQKWGVAEHLDEGKDMLRAILEADEYADYILDRRLACRQFGMNLPQRVSLGRLTEKYLGGSQYHGTAVRAYYFMRSYVPGIASDKIPPERFRNPAFALAFASLMGRAAAVDLVVGRAATETGEPIFDRYYEVLACGPDGLPREIAVTDHAGSFVKYREPFEELVPPYANVIRRREKFVSDYAAFAKAYVEGFGRRLAEIRDDYRARRRDYDDLFLHRPYDTAGSAAYRWSRVLARLDACDPVAVTNLLKKSLQS